VCLNTAFQSCTTYAADNAALRRPPDVRVKTMSGCLCNVSLVQADNIT